MPEGFSFDGEGSYNRWSFEHIGADDTVSRISFQAETWTEALEKFIQFLRGSGFFIDYDSIGINEKKHPCVSTFLIPSYYPDNDDASVDFPKITEDSFNTYGSDE